MPIRIAIPNTFFPSSHQPSKHSRLFRSIIQTLSSSHQSSRPSSSFGWTSHLAQGYYQTNTSTVTSTSRSKMEHQLAKQCRILPASFWPASDSDEVSLSGITGEDLIAEAGEGCNFCRYLLAWLKLHYDPRRCRKIIIGGDGNIPSKVPPSPGGLVFFRLLIEINFESQYAQIRNSVYKSKYLVSLFCIVVMLI